MEAALVDDKPSRSSDSDDPSLAVTQPLRDCITTLKDRHATVSRVHHERYEQVESAHTLVLIHTRS
jgi:protein regulator of cytokinesis 1